MPPINEGIGFGSNPALILTSNFDYLVREIRAGSFGVTITSVLPELDAGGFLRSAGDATVNGGLILVSRLAILVSKAGNIPPGPDVTTGVTPGSFRSNVPSGFKLLWQQTFFGWPSDVPVKFLPGEIETTDPDSSLYVVFGGLRAVLAGTNAAVGNISDAAATFALLSVAGLTYTQAQSQSSLGAAGGFRSLPRYANI